jgi:hypothetical protein
MAESQKYGISTHYSSQRILRNRIYGDTVTNMSGIEKVPKNERAGIEREFKRGALELAVLHLLQSGEAYGYDIVTQIADRTDGAL